MGLLCISLFYKQLLVIERRAVKACKMVNFNPFLKTGQRKVSPDFYHGNICALFGFVQLTQKNSGNYKQW